MNSLKKPTIDSMNPSDGPLLTLQPSPRILVAEDNEINRVLTSEILEYFGYAVSVATNGEEALQAVLAQPFDLILMDCQMPVLNGYETARRIRETEQGYGLAKTPIVALSGNPASENWEKCLAAGMDDYLCKPFTINEMQQIIARWLPVQGV